GQLLAGQLVVAGDQRADRLAAGEVAEVAQVVVGQQLRHARRADAVRVAGGDGQRRIDLVVRAETGGEVGADRGDAGEARVVEGGGEVILRRARLDRLLRSEEHTSELQSRFDL